MRPLRWLYTLPLRLRSLLRRGQADRDLDEELAYHIAQRTEQYIGDGLAPTDARAAALREWRGVEQLKEECRDMRKVSFIQDLAGDIRYGLRQMAAGKGFTIAVAASLALGIGANTAIFSLMDAVLFEMLPVKQPRQLVMLRWSAKGWPDVVRDLEGNSGEDARTGRSWSESFPYPVYEQLRDRNHVFSQTFAFAANTPRVNISMRGRAEAANAVMVSGNYFGGLGVYAAQGRAILPRDDVADAPPIAVLSHRFWQRRFGEDPSVVGKTMAVNGTPFTIAGIAPAEFFGLEPGTSPDLFVPLSQYPYLLPEYSAAAAESAGQAPPPLTRDTRNWWLVLTGRLLPGQSAERAQAELAVLFAQSIGKAGKAADPKTPVLETLPASQGLDGLRTQFSRPLFVLMAMVGAILLMACANAAGMLLARAAARQREIAVRLSLGARRSRLIRQLLTESAMLAVLGGAAGVLLARWASTVLLAWLSSGRHPLVVALHLDARILAFTLAVSVLTGVLFGLAPAWQATRVDVGPALKQGGGSGGRATGRFRSGRMLVAGQVALCLLLLVSAGLFLRTLRNLESTDLGFRPDHLLQFSVQPGLNGYQGARLIDYYRELGERIQSIPGVRSVGLSEHALVGSGVSTSDALIPGYTEGKRRVDLHRNGVSPGFFETMGIPLVLGRRIEAHDTPRAPKVAVVNEKLVRKHFHGDSPIGHILRFGDEKQPSDFEIVGVVKDAKYSQLRDEAPPTVYMSYLQESVVWSALTFEVRAETDPRALAPAIRQQALAQDKDVPLVDIKTQTEAVAQELVQERVFARLASLFGALALVLACIGLYGTMAYTVARRTGEIGIRMAIGARPLDILGMVLRESVRVVLIGSAAGLAAAVAATRLIRSQLYGLSPHDPLVLTGAALVLLAVTMLAACIPARRASRVDPLRALRNE
jgi:predicted permease